MLIGLFIGLERERSNRPAGMRTHFLVALGSVAVTVAGNSVSLQSGGDPVRLAAQVVSGIGFLGAGTILKEGVNVRGLTTSASLWVTACLAIVVGFGLYIEAGIGTLGVLIALTLFEKLERFIIAGGTVSTLEVVSDKQTDITKSLLKVLQRHRVVTDKFSVCNDENGCYIKLTGRVRNSHKITAILIEINNLPGVHQASITKSENYCTAI